MVFVFFVQPGDMMTFDNEISIMQSVADLKEKIKEKCGIKLEQQVLLINGGEPLDATKNLCSYMAGTDTNPIYLFSTNYEISKIRILDNLNYNDSDLLNSLTECYDLPVSLSTVKKRAQVAQELYNVAKKQLEFCESLVHDQYMQQQGWSAVIANLEDIVSEFKKRWEVFQKGYHEFIAEKDAYNALFEHFQDDKSVLQRIPILGTLLETQKDLECLKNSDVNTSTSQENEASTKEITLFEWISSSDSQSSLDDLYEVCKTNVSKFENEIVSTLEKQINEALQNAEKTEKKEIEGLNKRLFDLQELIIKIKKYVDHQSDMAQSFQQNQQRASNLRDLSILPDLCATHLMQLDLIKEHHKKLMDDRKRIVKAKGELSKSLITRIGWVQDVESWLLYLDNKLVYFHEQLQRLRKHLQVFQQLHLAPTTYLTAVTEVVRRRTFSQMFLLWASDLACNQLTIHNDEITRRKEFNSMFEGHFLKSLFPGLNDVPPSFATEAPGMFDAKLPKITEEDVERLKSELPDFADNLTLPDMTTIVNFFMGRSANKEKDKVDDTNKAVEDKLIQAVSDVGLASNLDKNLLKGTGSESCLVTAHGLPHLKDIDKGCESETDTEEFEKVGQSPLELNFDRDAIPQQTNQSVNVEKIVEKQDVSTSTEVLTSDHYSFTLPPKKPPRLLHRSCTTQTSYEMCSVKTTSLSTALSTTGSFTNLKNISLDSINELSSSRVDLSDSEIDFSLSGSKHDLSSTSRKCSDLSPSKTVFSASNLTKTPPFSEIKDSGLSGNALIRSKSTSLQSPIVHSPGSTSPISKRDQQQDFVSEEFYIDESLPSSVSVDTTTNNSQGSEFVRQLDNAHVVVALLQDNLQISRTEHEKIKSLFVNMGCLAKQEAVRLRVELNNLRDQVLSNSVNFNQHCGSLGISWDTLIVEFDNKEKALVEKLVQEHREEVSNLMKAEKLKSDQINSLEITRAKLEEWLEEGTKEKADLEQQITDLKEEYRLKVEEFDRKLMEKDVEKEKNLKELSENLKLEHKAEIDSIKSRFRLMTMERSPSCSSLEKEKSGDFITLPSHNSTLLAQMTENFEVDKENAVLEERHKWEKILKDRLEEMEKKYVQEKELWQFEVGQRALEDKDKQIDLLTEKTNNLLLECVKHKTTIQQLAEFSSEDRSAELIEQIDTLKKEKQALQVEIDEMKSVNRMSCSAALYESSRSDATTSPLKEIDDMSKSAIAVSSSRILNLNVDSCKPGDTVMILWDPSHENFKILQESKHMYFLHSDSMENLGLSIADGKPNKTYCSGEVYDKEYCHARKVCPLTDSENRYKVAKGTKFFRVKVKQAGLKDTSQSLYHPRPSTQPTLTGMSLSQSSASTFEPVSEEPSVASPPRSRLASTQEEDLPLDAEEPRTLTNRAIASPQSDDPSLGSQEIAPSIDQTQISTVTRSPSALQNASFYEEPEEIRPHSVEKNIAEDRGIEQSVEAIEHLENQKKSEDIDRVPIFTVFQSLLQNFE